MRQIIKDWCEFCENNKKFEHGHFFTLFMDSPSLDEIKEIFKYFDQKDELTDRMLRYLDRPKPQSDKVEILKDELRKFIIKDFKDRQNILLKLEIFNSFLAKPDFIFKSDLANNEAIIWDDIWSQNFFDFMIDNIIGDDEKAHLLYNSFYGITYDFDYRAYLFIPLVNTDYTGEYLFKFKTLGGLYAISDNKVYYSIKN